jgi:ribosomal protein S18 acetylase RimI-like enzyme
VATLDPAPLQVIEFYYDAVPRSFARAERIGPFTLFVNPGPGWAYYARPSLGSSSFSAEDVQRVRERQRVLHVPESFEWVAETTPTLATAAEAAGLHVSRHPLMLLCSAPAADVPPEIEIRLAGLSDDQALLHAIASVAFGHQGTAVGPADLKDAHHAVKRDPAEIAAREERLRLGRMVTAVAYFEGQPVGVGSHGPLDGTTELVGIGVLPAFRRRGIGGALTRRLVSDALEHGTRTVFLSADADDVARIYERVGFGTIGTACIAEPPPA